MDRKRKFADARDAAHGCSSIHGMLCQHLRGLQHLVSEDCWVQLCNAYSTPDMCMAAAELAECPQCRGSQRWQQVRLRLLYEACARRDFMEVDQVGGNGRLESPAAVHCHTSALQRLASWCSVTASGPLMT
jgi:hypothetical protein